MQELASWLLHLRAQGKRVYFQLMPSFGLRKRMHHDAYLEPPPENQAHVSDSTADYRTEPFIATFNSIAVRVMAQHDIPVVDFHSPTAPMSDVTVDRAHFIGSVGQAVNQMLVAVLCPDDAHEAVASFEGPVELSYDLHEVPYAHDAALLRKRITLWGWLVSWLQ